MTRRELLGFGIAAAATTLLPNASEGADGGASTPGKDGMGDLFQTVTETHPAREALRRLFPDPQGPTPAGFKPTGKTKRDYLPVITGIVDHFKTVQDDAGAIIDPFEHKERQYATPAFALGAALLVAEAGRGDLVAPAVKAFDFALAALVNHTSADQHADFYIPMLVHAHRILLAHASPSQADRDRWTAHFNALVPETTYRDVKAGGNWNLVNVSGECLRRKAGLVTAEQSDAQAAYLERCLTTQKARMTRFGMYQDPNSPLAYDAFPRLWLEDVMAEGAYEGPHKDELEMWLAKGSLSSLLLLSPIGEWACGGRSAFHQWNEAETAVICENAARRWQKAGRPDIAGACKRAAHLALGSVERWRRPSGELWIVKNHAEPSLRHGYEGYSFHSQYNLLAGAMLALAYQHADDSLPERPVPSERGGYVYDLRDIFHKVCAVGGGTYVLLDTSADPHYNASGLLRVHKAGVTTPLLSDNAASGRGYGPASAKDKAAVTTGLSWKGADGVYHGVADAHGTASLAVDQATPDVVSFTVGYAIGDETNAVLESYTLKDGAVTVRAAAPGAPAGTPLRLTLPLLVSDGATDLHTSVNKAGSFVTESGKDSLHLDIVEPSHVGSVRVEGPRLATHNGWVQTAVADLPAGTREAVYRIRLE